jgi:hypothetical protein
MNLVGWTLDIARDQSPQTNTLHAICARSKLAGYNAIGLYLEHRYAYPNEQFAIAPGALTPQAARDLVTRHQPAGLRIIPFLNTLGHMEGFIRSQGGQWLAEGDNAFSLQLCPSRPECVEFARQLVADVLPVFDDEWVHLGGDEAWELGNCPRCAERAKSISKHGIYGEHYADLCVWVLEQGRRPALWGDMLLNHPEAMKHIPRKTLIFDWQYFNRPRESTAKFRAAGFDVICCPSLQTYNSGWCFLDDTQRIIDEHAADARELGALGVFVTTWEFTFFSHLNSVLPLVSAAGERLARGTEWNDAILKHSTPAYARAARILGREIPAASPFLKPGTWRTLRDRLVIRQNPFELWKAWRSEARGPIGEDVLRLCASAREIVERAPAADVACELRMPIELHAVALEWVRAIDAAAADYSAGKLARASDGVRGSVTILLRLKPELGRIAAAGGSGADPARLERLLQKIQAAAERIETLPHYATWRPSFETITHDNYIPGDQAAWRTGERVSPPPPA